MAPWPLLTTLDAEPRVIGSSRETLFTLQHASSVHHATMGARERDRRAAVLSVPSRVVQGATAVVTRGPSRD